VEMDGPRIMKVRAEATKAPNPSPAPMP
jgi:hypothetical protein